MCQLFIVPSIRGTDIGFLEWPDIRSFEHLLELLDFIDYAFNVHPQQYSEPALTRHFVLGREALRLTPGDTSKDSSVGVRQYRVDQGSPCLYSFSNLSSGRISASVR